MSTITLRIPSHVRAVIDDDGAVLLDVNKGTYFSLNGIGAEVWKRLEAGMTLDEIREVLVKEFQASEEVVTRDIQTFVQRLSEKALIDVSQ